MAMHILIIDDEEIQRMSISRYLRKKGYSVSEASNGEEGLEVIRERPVDVVITDYRMPGMNGYEVVRKVKEWNPHVEILVLTAYSNIREAVDIMKAGAYDYLTKPIQLEELDILLQRIAEKHQLKRENEILKEQLREQFRFPELVFQSREMAEVVNLVARVADSKATVLILGESGTGKELVARMIHEGSSRKTGPFIAVNMAALSENIIESELFGHEKGAFTGAIQQKKGKFELASGGTLFIDEVGDIPLPVQVKLLRVIQFGEIERVGGQYPIPIDVRIIAATHRNLKEMVQEGTFREDLYYRLNVVTIQLPPLRKRREDIPLLVEAFIKKYASHYEKPVEGIEHRALHQLMEYAFPGNVRELENMIERAVILTRTRRITLADLPELRSTDSAGSLLDPYDFSYPYPEKVRAFEKAIIEKALELTNGNKSAAARMLGITERHLRSRLERLTGKAENGSRKQDRDF